MAMSQIDARIFFWPLSMLPPFERQRKSPVSYATFSRAINLPSYHDMTLEDLNAVQSILSEIFKNSNDIKYHKAP
jgi:perosamine synthetase